MVAILHGWESNPAFQGYSHPNNTDPTARLTALCYRVRYFTPLFLSLQLYLCFDCFPLTAIYEQSCCQKTTQSAHSLLLSIHKSNGINFVCLSVLFYFSSGFSYQVSLIVQGQIRDTTSCYLAVCWSSSVSSHLLVGVPQSCPNNIFIAMITSKNKRFLLAFVTFWEKLMFGKYDC